jgi:uncharacterized protein involved in type VI secretion and phage assembly
MSTDGFGVMPVVKVGGSALSAEIAGRIRRVVVDSDANGTDSCRITFTDADRDLFSSGPIDLKKPLTVTATAAREEKDGVIFDGLIYSIGHDFDERGAYSTVLAYDRAYLLYTGVHTKVYKESKDSDIARKIANEVGLKAGDIDDSPVVHTQIAQANETYFEFLTRRAREVGFTLVVTGEKLHFGKQKPAGDAPKAGDLQSTDPLQLVPGSNLTRLAVRLSGAAQVSEVEVRGWDMKTKKPVTATAPAKTDAATVHDTPDSVAGTFGSARQVVVDVPYDTVAAAQAAATAEAERLASTMVHAEGEAIGDPRLLAMTPVSIGRTGARLEGKLTLSSAKHVWNQRGYHVSFVASGGHSRSSVLSLTSNGRPGATRRIDSLVVALVTSLADPDQLGRVQVQFPWLDDTYVSDWARVLQVGAGKQQGMAWLPEVHDEVLVGFEQGDFRQPYVLGGLYNGVDKLPFDKAIDTKDTGKVDIRGWRSRFGHELKFVDKDGEERIELHTKDSKVAVVLDAKKGSEKLTVDVATKVTITIDGKSGDLTIKSGGNLKITADGSGEITASKGLKLGGGSGNVEVKGKEIHLN